MGMKAILLVLLCWTAGTGLVARASVVPDALGEANCKALSNVDFSGIQEAPTKVTQANLVEASGDVPAHCQVEGYVTPNVGFNLLLPLSNWNGKFLERGCGGDCGVISTSDALYQCRGPLRRGYACIISDMGHIGWGGLWAYNDLQAQVDFGYRGAHVTALAGKAITEYYYGNAPKYSYFTGCSTGGREALVEAERFPWDFDGIIAGAPWINDSDSAMQYVWNDVVLSNKDGKPLLSRADLELVHDAALRSCDLQDGVKEGFIPNPLACHFDPEVLVCKPKQNSKCITHAQAEAVEKVYFGPTTSTGKRLYTGGSPIGSELAWVGVSLSKGNSWAIPYFRYEVMPPAGPNWQESDFNFDRDYKRFDDGIQESLLNAANPDLRKFKSAGGKLILYQGGMDFDVVPANTIDFYQTVEKTMGGRAATQEFLRLFMIPGMEHCSGGPGAFAIDYLSYLENWVERDQAPNVMLGAHVEEPVSGFPLSQNDHILFTRPVFPYPLQAKYKGSGDPNDASSFRPAEPQWSRTELRSAGSH